MTRYTLNDCIGWIGSKLWAGLNWLLFTELSLEVGQTAVKMLQIVDIISIITCTIQFNSVYITKIHVLEVYWHILFRYPSEICRGWKFWIDASSDSTSVQISSPDEVFSGKYLGWLFKIHVDSLYKHFFIINTSGSYYCSFYCSGKKCSSDFVNQITPQTPFKYQSGDGFTREFGRLFW